MDKHKYLQLHEVSENLRIDIEICRQFADFGIIHLITVENIPYLDPEDIPTLRHAVSLYRDLGVNKEGIEVILSMRERIIQLQEEVRQLNRKIERLESEYFQKNVEIPKKRGLFFEL